MKELHSIVIPVFREAENIHELHRRLTMALSVLPDYELIFVEDHSPDDTYDRLLALSLMDRRVRVVRLSRRYGHQVALTAGIDMASGVTVTVMDGDLQHPPELVPEMVDLWRSGVDVVFGVKGGRRTDGPVKRHTASLFYRLMGLIADDEIPAQASDFRLMSRRAANSLKGMRESNRYLRGLVGSMGLARAHLEYEPEARFAGETKYSLPRMVRLAIDGLMSFSTIPLQVATWLGLSLALLGFAYGVFLAALFAMGRIEVPGYTSLFVAVVVLSGVQLIVLGVVGSYIGRIYEEVRQRPLYLVEDVKGFSAPVERAFSDSCLPTPSAVDVGSIDGEERGYA